MKIINYSRILIFSLVLTTLFAQLISAEEYLLARRIFPEEGEYKQKRYSFKDFNRAEKFYKKKRYKEALRTFKNFIRNYPESNLFDEALYRVAQIYYVQRDYKNAREYFQVIVEKFSSSDLYRESEFQLALCNLFLGNYSSAINIFNKFLTVYKISKKQKGKTHFYKAKSLQGKRDYLRAMEEYYQAKKFLADKGLLATAKKELRKTIEKDLSIKQLNKFIKKHPRDNLSGYALYRSASLYLKKKNYPAYKTALKKYLREFPRHELYPRAKLEWKEIESILTEGKVKVGIILPLSGKMGPLGRNILQGIRLAFELYDSQAGKSSSQFELVIKNSSGDPQTALKKVEELIRFNKVSVIIGPIFSRTLRKIIPLADKYAVPLFSPAASEKDITRQSKYVFRNSLTVDLQARAIVEYATQNLHLSKFALLYPDNSYGKRLKDSFIKYASAAGGEILVQTAYKDNATDFGAQIKKIGGLKDDKLKAKAKKMLKKGLFGPENKAESKKHKLYTIEWEGEFPTEPEEDPFEKGGPFLKMKYEAIFLPGFSEQVGLIIPQLFFYNLKGIKLLGTNGWNSPELIKLAGKYAEGAVFTDGFFVNSSAPQIQEFVQRFKEKTGRQPDILAAQSFDTAKIILTVLREGVRTRAEIRKRLSKLSYYKGVTGVTHVSPSGDFIKRPFLLRVSGGEIIQIE